MVITLTELSPRKETVKPFTKRQLKAVDLRVEGYSYDQVAEAIDVTPKTIYM